MAVVPRESWTDERLDDFREEVNRRFDEANNRLDRRIDETNQRMEEGFAVMRAEFQRLNDRLDALYHLMFRGMIAFGVGIIAVIVAFVLNH